MMTVEELTQQREKLVNDIRTARENASHCLSEHQRLSKICDRLLGALEMLDQLVKPPPPQVDPELAMKAVPKNRAERRRLKSVGQKKAS